MAIAVPTYELNSIEKLREQELEEARMIQGVMLPSQPLCVGGVTISHEFQPASAVGGDYLDTFLFRTAPSDCTLATFPARVCRPHCTPHSQWEPCVEFRRLESIPVGC